MKSGVRKVQGQRHDLLRIDWLLAADAAAN